jgi:hypothetical protein
MMPNHEIVTVNLRGMYRDVLRDARGRVTWDSGWQENAIVTFCRRLLAGLMRGEANTLGIQGLQVGSGLDTWDSAGLPSPSSGQEHLEDPLPYTVSVLPGVLEIRYLENGTTNGTTIDTPTNRLQIAATLGPGVPPWPTPEHPTSTLREFGLIGQLDGNTRIINYVTHVAIAKDAASTLDRIIWLVF